MNNKNRILLGVNIDHVATLRQARGTRYPDPVQAAIEAEEAGADGITLHLREDRRHVQERDVLALEAVLLTRMNLEMAATDEMVAFAKKVKPAHICLVPERREELTTEGGLDVVSQALRMAEITKQLTQMGAEVSLFIDPDPLQIEAAARCRAPAIEIHTGHYADAPNETMQKQELERIVLGVEHALSLGLIVNAGHGLCYHNVEPIAAIPGINELNIGHSIISRALFTGFKPAVREMKQLMLEAARSG